MHLLPEQLLLQSPALGISRAGHDVELLTAVLDDNEETGWKYIHGDVFRFPPHKNVFCAFVGTGAQVRY